MATLYKFDGDWNFLTLSVQEVKPEGRRRKFRIDELRKHVDGKEIALIVQDGNIYVVDRKVKESLDKGFERPYYPYNNRALEESGYKLIGVDDYKNFYGNVLVCKIDEIMSI